MARAPVAVTATSRPSVVAELGWILNLLVQRAAYAEPALEELDLSLLPGVATLRPAIKERFAALWTDGLAGCPELLVAADQGHCMYAEAPTLFAWLSTLPRGVSERHELLTEPAADRRHIRRRLGLLNADVRMRRAYRDILEEVFELARPVWERRGRAKALKAAAAWSRLLAGQRTPSAVLHLMPPRHPLAAAERRTALALLRSRRSFTVVPIYFCMSGGQVADLAEELQIGVPASALEPSRRRRDAAFVADRARILAEPTRVLILIHLMSAPSGVMEMTRALGLSQPTVSEHVRVLAAAGLIRGKRQGSGNVYSASPRRFERLLEDARGTLARWS